MERELARPNERLADGARRRLAPNLVPMDEHSAAAGFPAPECCPPVPVFRRVKRFAAVDWGLGKSLQWAEKEFCQLRCQLFFVPVSKSAPLICLSGDKCNRKESREIEKQVEKEKYGNFREKANDRTLLHASGRCKGRGYNEMKKKKLDSCKYKNTRELLTKKPQPVK